MNKMDGTQFVDNLNTVMEVFGKPPLTARAAALWYEELKEFSLPYLTDALDDWTKTQGKAPVVADIFTRCNHRRTDEIERTARTQKAQEKQEVSDFFSGDTSGRDAAQERAVTAIRQMLDHSRVRDPKYWAERIMDRAQGGATVESCVFKMARDALR